jgi:hypothetical protein
MLRATRLLLATAKLGFQFRGLGIQFNGIGPLQLRRDLVASDEFLVGDAEKALREVKGDQLLFLDTIRNAVNPRLHSVKTDLQAIAALVEFVIGNSIGDDPTKYRNRNDHHQSAVGELIVFIRAHSCLLFLQTPYKRISLVHLPLHGVQPLVLFSAEV